MEHPPPTDTTTHTAVAASTLSDLLLPTKLSKIVFYPSRRSLSGLLDLLLGGTDDPTVHDHDHDHDHDHEDHHHHHNTRLATETEPEDMIVPGPEIDPDRPGQIRMRSPLPPPPPPPRRRRLPPALAREVVYHACLDGLDADLEGAVDLVARLGDGLGRSDPLVVACREAVAGHYGLRLTP